MQIVGTPSTGRILSLSSSSLFEQMSEAAKCIPRSPPRNDLVGASANTSRLVVTDDRENSEEFEVEMLESKGRLDVSFELFPPMSCSCNPGTVSRRLGRGAGPGL